MRSPLNTIVMTASYLSALNVGSEVNEAAKLLVRSGASIQGLLDDLVDFNRTKLGLGINVVLANIDLSQVLSDEVEQLRGANAGRLIELYQNGDLRGEWDGKRLQQLLRNLISNALKYGSPDSSVRVSLLGEEQEVRLEVANDGQTMEQTALEGLIDPLKRGPGSGDDGGLGLGLFIVREITRAHGGHFGVRCQDQETCFSVVLPRQSPR
jgi:signal transduction histidine kinase